MDYGFATSKCKLLASVHRWNTSYNLFKYNGIEYSMWLSVDTADLHVVQVDNDTKVYNIL